MANLAEVDFSNFELYELSQEPHWAHEIADGVVTEMAEVFGVQLSQTPTSEELGQLVGAVGTSKVLQENIGQVQDALGTDDNALEIAADWAERSGVQKPLDRSLWTPSCRAMWVDLQVISGAVANWQDRTATLLETTQYSEKVAIPVGNRLMDTKTELVNPNIVAFKEANNRLPTESMYAEDVIKPRLERAGFEVLISPYDTKNGDEIAGSFVRDFPDLYTVGENLTFVRVANAGIQLAVQFRKEIKDIKSNFDSNDNPQLFVLTDTFPVARTEEQAKDPVNFQNPMTAIRQAALTAKLLQEVVEQKSA